jgi:hypothetical protein
VSHVAVDTFNTVPQQRKAALELGLIRLELMDEAALESGSIRLEPTDVDAFDCVCIETNR